MVLRIGSTSKHVRPTIVEDGKRLKPNANFAFSRVFPGLKILGIDDLSNNYDFDSMFPLISNGIEVEIKFKPKFRIPYSESPKIVLTTNSFIEGDGDSREARKVEFGLTRYFNSKHQPTDEFGHLFFNEWDSEQWKGFYLTIFNCVQVFLNKGIVNPPAFNANLINLIMRAGVEFQEFLMEEIEYNKRYNKREFYEMVIAKFPKFNHHNQNTITSWVKLYAKAYDLNYEEGHSGDNHFFIIQE